MEHAVTDWFARRTFHHRQFADAAALLDAKRAAGTTVSVCLPTRNEAATVGKVVRVLREALVDRVPLVDELVVMDGDSTDGTQEIAAAEGATVVAETDVLPEAGPGGGKGEGLWKSLHACTGDVLCWVDTDIVNIDPRFVTGLVGPLLADPSIGYVKAFYERPLADASGYRPTGGGRVTELLARPLLNAFWPELAGLVQPLSGEFAGRRELMERLPFYAGYGVELGLLVDILRTAGADAIAQCDLELRVHRNQGVPALSRMSFGILQAAMDHLAAEGRVAPDSWATTYTQFERLAEGAEDADSPLDRYEIQARELTMARRPPIVEVEGYARRRAEISSHSNA